MKENVADRRVRRTLDQVRRALISLLMEKDLKDITVRELTELADINRGTFYLHYRDIPEVFSRIEDEVVEDFSQYIETYKSRPALLRMPSLGDLIRYIAMNEEICRALLRSRDSGFIARIIDLSRPRSKEEFRQHYRHWDEELRDYYFDFICWGSIAILRRWLESGMRESAEQITLAMEKMISTCIEKIDEKIGNPESDGADAERGNLACTTSLDKRNDRE
ncbi:MAG: TetR/AcrR family transcriptional regulator [Treponema sp.]|jgi:AcrR family transcriptional regulator|nr:TetR/AcrR family transcriptional regulator [Treponema sp.]